MHFRRRRIALLLASGVLGSTVPQGRADRGGRFTLDPAVYRSPSGTCELHVDPSTIYGQGPGSYRMVRGGVEVRAAELPFTLWEAGVTDAGVAAGCACSGGMENSVPEGEDGRLHLVILDPQGAPRLNEVLPRRGAFTCLSRVDRNVAGFVLDPANDRFIVRTDETRGYLSLTQTWRTYRLSTGALLDEFQFDDPHAGEHELWFVRGVRAVAGTPLLIVNRDYTKYDREGRGPRASGRCSTLLDPAGNPVWELDRPGDDPGHGEDEGGEDEQPVDLADYVREHGAVLGTDQPGRFDLWFVREGQPVAFAAEPDGAGGRRIAEQARTGYRPSVAVAAAAPLEPLTLRHLGAITLPVDAAAQPVIRSIEYFDVDDRGRIGFLRNEPDRSTTFVLVAADGGIIRTVSLKEPLGENDNLPTATRYQGRRGGIAGGRRPGPTGGSQGPAAARGRAPAPFRPVAGGHRCRWRRRGFRTRAGCCGGSAGLCPPAQPVSWGRVAGGGPGVTGAGPAGTALRRGRGVPRR